MQRKFVKNTIQISLSFIFIFRNHLIFKERGFDNLILRKIKLQLFPTIHHFDGVY